MSMSSRAQAEIPSSGDPLIDNLRAVELQIYELNADRKFAERWNLERRVEARYGRQIAKALEQSSTTLINRIQSINRDFTRFGHSLESTEFLREAATRYRDYKRLMKFSGEPNAAQIRIEETPSQGGANSARFRLMKNGRAMGEITPDTMEFIRKSEILGVGQFKPDSGESTYEYEFVQPRTRALQVPGRMDLETHEPQTVR